MIANKILEWERFWYKIGDQITFDNNGFLLNPSEQNSYIKNNLKDFLSLKDIPCLILLGEAGSGKSVALEKLCGNYGEIDCQAIFLYKNLNEYTNEQRLIDEIFNSDKINTWLTSNKEFYLFLDSFDECLLKIQSLQSILEVKFNKYRHLSERLKIRIISRTGFVNKKFEQFFIDYYGKDNVGIYKIAPLRECDIRLAARELNVNDEYFIKEIITREVQALAVNPLTLNFLLLEYKSKKCISSSKENIFYEGCKLLCTEPDDNRRLYSQDYLSPEREIALASRIAAVMVFCNKSYIDLNYMPLDNNFAITLSMLSEGEETTGKNLFSFSQKDLLKTVKESSLFTEYDILHFGFAHEEYKNFLAAKFIANHQLEIEQIKSLITISTDDEGQTVPQVSGTARWLNILSEPLSNYSIQNDPINLVYSDIINFNNDQKRELLRSIMDKFNNNKINDSDWGLKNQYVKLKYPQIAEQIKPYIENKGTYFLARRVAIDIVESCEIVELNDLLLKILLDKGDDITIRSYAIHALLTLGDKAIKEQLRGFIIESHDDDEDDELKGYALQALWPDLISADVVFQHLTEPKRANYIGSYMFFINYIFSNCVESDFLNFGLRWLLDNDKSPSDVYYIFETLSNSIIHNSWSSYDRLKDKNLFAQVIWKRITNYKPIFPTLSIGMKNIKLDISSDVRLDVLTHIVNFVNDLAHETFFLSNVLISDNDFYSILNHCIKEQDSALGVKWAHILNSLNYSDDSKKNDALLTNMQNCSALNKVFEPRFRAIEINSPEANELKRIYDENENRKKNKTTIDNSVDIINRIVGDINKIRSISNDPILWIQLFMDLTITKNNRFYGDELNSDITSLYAWSIISESMHTEIIELGKEYILSCNDNYKNWFGENVYHRPAALGYKLLLLLQKNDHSFIIKISPEIWNNWIHILLSYPESYGIAEKNESYVDLIAIAYEGISSAVIEIVKLKIEDVDRKQNFMPAFLNKIKKCVDENMQNTLLSIVQENKLCPNNIACILDCLLNIKNKKALSVISNLVCGAEYKLKLESALILAKYCDSDQWEFIRGEIDKDDNFGKEFFLIYASRYDSRSTLLWKRISEKQIAHIYIKLETLFPKNEDPVFEGAHFIGDRESVGQMRNYVIRYLTDIGAIESLNLIKEKFPDSNIDYYVVDAKNNYRKKNWRPIEEPSELLRITNNKEMRIIQNPNDLLNLIIDSLKRFETRLQGNNPLSFTLWNFDKKNKTYTHKSEEELSDLLKDHLKTDLKIYGISANREIQLRRPNNIPGCKSGEKTDLTVSFTNPKTKEGFNVIIEVKGIWNSGLKTSIREQLAERYLKERDCVHGLYLVGWYCCDASKKIKNNGFHNIDEAKSYFNDESKKISNDVITIKSFILDCSFRN